MLSTVRVSLSFMKFLIDENLPDEVAELLRGDGHDAVSVVERGLAKSDDPKLATLAKAESRAIVTADVDFAQMNIYPPQDFEGLVVLRLGHQGKSHVQTVIRALLPLLKAEALKGKLWIVEDERIRIREPGA
jgi:predicted nuclease of predicted toxin-antitoxin system